MPNSPNGTETRNTRRHSMGASTPPSSRPRNDAADRGDAVDAHRLAALAGREGVGQDRAGVGEQERAADALQDPHDDDPQNARHPGQERHRQQDREQGEHGEAEVVHLDPAVDVAHPAQADHQHRGDQDEPEEDPQEVRGVGGLQRVQLDAPEEGRQRDQQDGLVDRDHQDAERGVRQRDPLVPVSPVARRRRYLRLFEPSACTLSPWLTRDPGATRPQRSYRTLTSALDRVPFMPVCRVSHAEGNRP